MPKSLSASGALTLAAMLTLAACSSDSDDSEAPTSTVQSTPTTIPLSSLAPTGTLEGVVIEVEGTLGLVVSFTVRQNDGTEAIFVPVEGLLFDETAPIDHLRDHMVSGAPVQVEYSTLVDGTLSALAVGDG